MLLNSARTKLFYSVSTWLNDDEHVILRRISVVVNRYFSVCAHMDECGKLNGLLFLHILIEFVSMPTAENIRGTFTATEVHRYSPFRNTMVPALDQHSHDRRCTIHREQVIML